MAKVAKRLKLRLFLEGVEVPVISAVVNAGVNTPATASIQVIPTDDIHRIKPRTLVHVFFLDLYPSETHFKSEAFLEDRDQPRDKGRLGQAAQDGIDGNYRLLFAGEVIGYTFAKSMGQRQAVLQCMDFTTYWDAAKQYFHTGGGNSSASKGAAFVGSASIGYEEDSDSSPTQSLINVLNSRPSSAPNLRGLLGGIVHLHETIGGVYSGVSRFRGLNDFFSASELRLRLVNMIGASQHDTSSAKLFNHKSYSKWIRQHLARNKSLTTFRGIIDGLLQRIYHDYVSIPTPAFIPGHFEKVRMSVAAGKAFDATGEVHIKNRIAHLRRHETIGALNPGKGFIDDARDGLSKDNIPVSEQDGDMIVLDDARNYYNGDAPGVTKGVLGVLEGGQDKAGKQALKHLALARETDHVFLDGASAAIGKRKGAEGFDKEDWVNRLRFGTAGTGKKEVSLGTKAREARLLYEKALRARKYRKVTRNVWITGRMPAIVFRPNIFFTPPPRCNVIFPDRYESFTFRRSFLQEVTRLQLTGQKEWKADSLGIVEGGKKNTYYAPNIPDVVGKLAAKSAKRGVRFILEHEIYTGIIPVFETIGDIAPFAKIARSAPGVGIPTKSSMTALQGLAAQAGEKAKQALMGQKGFSEVLDKAYLESAAKKAAESILSGSNTAGRKKLHYLQRIANFNFCLRRFMPRMAELSLPFSPYLLPGFPVLVVDRYMPEPIKERMGHKPTQYLGMLSVLTHSVSQQGGRTSIQLSCCRTDDEYAEFLGPFKKKRMVPAGFAKKTSTIEMASGTEDSKPGVQGKGEHRFHNFPETLEEREVDGGTELVNTAGDKLKGKVQTFTGAEIEKGLVGKVIKGKGKVVSAIAASGGSEVKINNRGALVVTEGAMEVVYHKQLFVNKPINVPPEKALFPGWMSPIYSNINIGRHFYQPLFKVGAITDPLLVVGAGTKVLEETPSLDKLSASKANRMSQQALNKLSPTHLAANAKDFRERLKSEKLGDAVSGSLAASSVAEIELGATIRQAVIEVTKAYKELKSRDRDLDAFMKGYGWRPIATMIDVLGKANFDVTKKPSKGKRRLADGEGLHSRAFGPYQGLAHLEHEQAYRVFKKGRRRKVAAGIDPRMERFLWARAYFNTLSNKAQLG